MRSRRSFSDPASRPRCARCARASTGRAAERRRRRWRPRRRRRDALSSPATCEASSRVGTSTTAAGPPVADVDALDEGDREGERLARAGRRLREDVAAGERVREDVRLDRERCVDVTLGERTHDARGHRQARKRTASRFELLVSLLGRDPSASTAQRRNRRSQTSRDDGAVRARRVAVAAKPGTAAFGPIRTLRRTPDEYRRRRVRPPYPFTTGGGAMATSANERTATEEEGVLFAGRAA